MLVTHTLFGTVDKVKISIDRLKAFEPKDRPYWLAFSGGKFKEEYLRCFDKMYQNRIDRGLPLNNWKCGKDIFDWWVGDLKQDTETELSLLDEVEE